MAKYKITRLAQNDLQSIWDYTVKEWSVSQAEKYIDGLLSCFDALATGSASARPIDHIRQGYKKATYGRHLVFFRASQDQMIEIIRVLHVSMDIESRLGDE